MIEVSEYTYRLKMAEMASRIASGVDGSTGDIASYSVRMAVKILDLCDVYIDGTKTDRTKTENKSKDAPK